MLSLYLHATQQPQLTTPTTKTLTSATRCHEDQMRETYMSNDAGLVVTRRCTRTLGPGLQTTVLHPRTTLPHQDRAPGTVPSRANALSCVKARLLTIVNWHSKSLATNSPKHRSFVGANPRARKRS